MRYMYIPKQFAHHEDMVYRIDDCVWIPLDECNRDYQQYLAWLAEGNTPEPRNPE